MEDAPERARGAGPGDVAGVGRPGDTADLPERVGHYEIRRQLGAGAIGVVYEGWDPRLRRSVAVKMLLSADAKDHQAQRLVREAQALAQLRHPNVVAVYDVGTHEGRVYVVMELVAGETLGDAPKDGDGLVHRD
ncbi:MAG: protein kinase, partial [Deltaproteobacteria bacterium]|nr:protein kinase [Deltaproteobacteria bacterium]